MRIFGPEGAVLAAVGLAVGLLALTSGAEAQSSSNNSSGSGNGSGRMWGSTGSGGSSSSDSAAMHAQDGNSAGQVNAAKQGFLFYGGPGLSITAIGSQSIVSTTVVGNNNATNVSASQTSNNAGAVSNSGSIVASPP